MSGRNRGRGRDGWGGPWQPQLRQDRRTRGPSPTPGSTGPGAADPGPAGPGAAGPGAAAGGAGTDWGRGWSDGRQQRDGRGSDGFRPVGGSYGAAYLGKSAHWQRKAAHWEQHWQNKAARMQRHGEQWQLRRTEWEHRRRALVARGRRVPGPLRGPLVLSGIVGVLVAVAMVMAVVAVTVATGLAFAPVLIVGGVLFSRRRRARRLAAGGAPNLTAAAPVAVASPVDPVARWHEAKARFGVVAQEYAGYECDPLRVLELPALADVRVDSTARFISAFAEAQAMETDLEPPAEHREMFTAAVERAERAWRAALDAAERLRTSGLDPEERATVERVVKLLTTARDTTVDTERHIAYVKARAELAKLERTGHLRLPKTAAAALETRSRGALPA